MRCKATLDPKPCMRRRTLRGESQGALGGPRGGAHSAAMHQFGLRLSAGRLQQHMSAVIEFSTGTGTQQACR